MERLSACLALVSELGRPLAMWLAAVLQHVQVLEASGMVRTQRPAGTRTCVINPAALRSAESWIAERCRLSERRLDRSAITRPAPQDWRRPYPPAVAVLAPRTQTSDPPEETR